MDVIICADEAIQILDSLFFVVDLRAECNGVANVELLFAVIIHDDVGVTASHDAADNAGVRPKDITNGLADNESVFGDFHFKANDTTADAMILYFFHILKHAIVEGLAQMIIDGDVPQQLYNKTVFSVDLPGMLAGARYRGDFEERLKDLMDAVMQDGDIVLFIDEIHTIVGAGSSSENGMDAANILKPMLSRGDLQVIGATTIEEYRKYIEKDSALERRFTPVTVE
jgi:hypothetical protein